MLISDFIASVDHTSTRHLDRGFVTDIIVSRDINGKLQHNIIKYYHDRPDESIQVGETYRFSFWLNGRKRDNDGKTQVFNELRLKNALAV